MKLSRYPYQDSPHPAWSVVKSAPAHSQASPYSHQTAPPVDNRPSSGLPGRYPALRGEDLLRGGEFSNGITTIQSMYAPEFSSHSEGIRINIK